MSKIKVSTLTGPLLNYWAGKANGEEGLALDQEYCYYRPDSISRITFYSPSTDWSQGGPIIEREKIGAIWSDNQDCWVSGINGRGVSGGPTAAIAAMRCFVASKFGEEVDAE